MRATTRAGSLRRTAARGQAGWGARGGSRFVGYSRTWHGGITIRPALWRSVASTGGTDMVNEKDWEGFAEHASISAIDHEVRCERRRMDDAARRLRRLVELLAVRRHQVLNGTWPPSATAPDGASQKPASPSPGAYEDEQKKETE